MTTPRPPGEPAIPAGQQHLAVPDMLQFEDDRVVPPRPRVAQPSAEAREWWWVNRMMWEALCRRVEQLKNPPLTADSWFYALLGVAASALLGLVTILLTVPESEDSRAPALVFFGCVAVFAVLGMILTRSIRSEGSASFMEQKDALKAELTEMQKHFREAPSNPERPPVVITSTPPIPEWPKTT